VPNRATGDIGLGRGQAVRAPKGDLEILYGLKLRISEEVAVLAVWLDGEVEWDGLRGW
jgi:hypothetical protein